MKYYKIDINRRYPEFERISSSAQGKDIEDAEYYFDKIGKGEILYDAPMFDYFYLESFDKKEYWEWQINDVHDFIGEGSQIKGWLVSSDLKLILESFKIAQPYHFYLSKLLYKEKKIDYYIFQFAGRLIAEKIREQILFENSIFCDPQNNQDIFVESKDEFIKEKKRILSDTNDYDKGIKIKKLCIKEYFDFFPMATFMYDNVVSERLKRCIEENGITGFEFSELDYEIVV